MPCETVVVIGGVGHALAIDDLDLEIDLGPIADLLSHVADAVGNALDSDVVDTVSEQEKAAPRPVLDNDYEIRPCQPDPQEDPAKNKAEAERDARWEPVLGS